MSERVPGVVGASAVERRRTPRQADGFAKPPGADMHVRAIQDRGCLGAAKFFYQFPAPVCRALIAAFSDCDVVWREFSKIVPSAKDLVIIRKSSDFNASIVIGANRVVVYFNGPADNPPQDALDSFARRLQTVGYTTVVHSREFRPQCGDCAAGLRKACSRAGGPGSVDS